MLVLVELLVVPYAHSDDLVLLIIPAAVLCVVHLRSDPRSLPTLWIRPTLLALYLAPVLVVYYRQHFMAPVMLATFLLLWRLAPPPTSGAGAGQVSLSQAANTNGGFVEERRKPRMPGTSIQR
jgi:hypothetical protein